MLTTTQKLLAVAATTAIAAGSGAAIAADTATRVEVTPAATLHAGDRAPFDAPGVRAIRQGRTIPSGYTLVGYQVHVQRGSKPAGAAIIASCPGTKRLRTFAVTGRASFQATDVHYAGKRRTLIASVPGIEKVGGTADGTVYAVCR